MPVTGVQTCALPISLTTGTFNLVVKDRIAFRLSGAPSGLDGPATRANPAVLETLQTYSAAQNPVNPRIPQNFLTFSTSGKTIGVGGRGAKARNSAQPYGLPLGFAKTPISRRMPKRKTEK